MASWSLLILSTCITSENVVSSSSEKSIGSNKRHNLVGSRIQFVRLKIFINWFKRWSFSINKFTFKSPVIIIRGDDSNALSNMKVFPEVIYCNRGPINSTYKNFKSREDYF